MSICALADSLLDQGDSRGEGLLFIKDMLQPYAEELDQLAYKTVHRQAKGTAPREYPLGYMAQYLIECFSLDTRYTYDQKGMIYSAWELLGCPFMDNVRMLDLSSKPSNFKVYRLGQHRYTRIHKHERYTMIRRMYVDVRECL
jgi:hypothetical protein